MKPKPSIASGIMGGRTESSFSSEKYMNPRKNASFLTVPVVSHTATFANPGRIVSYAVDKTKANTPLPSYGDQKSFNLRFEIVLPTLSQSLAIPCHPLNILETM